jgi:protein SHQ1
MITPKFRLDQNDDFLFIFIRAPYAKLNALDIFVDRNDFRFYCKPYFLRLNLPGNIIESNSNDNNDQIYNFDKKTFEFKFLKENKSEHFDGLDLLTKLLTPIADELKQIEEKKVLIEEIDDDNNKDNDDDNDDDDEIEWFHEQNPNESDDDNDDFLGVEDSKYGFASLKSNVFKKLGVIK